MDSRYQYVSCEKLQQAAIGTDNPIATAKDLCRTLGFRVIRRADDRYWVYVLEPKIFLLSRIKYGL